VTAPLATGTYAVLRGTTTDAYGDAIDATTTVDGYEALVGSLVERTRQTRRRVDGMPRDARSYTCRLPSWVEIQDDDRIKDNTTGDIFTIFSWRRVANPLTGPVLTLDLVRVT